MGGAIVLWALFWPVPTEVMGKGVLIYPNNAGVLNARAGARSRPWPCARVTGFARATC